MTSSRAAVGSGGLPPTGQRRRLPLAGLPKPVARARALTSQALADWYGLADGPQGEPGIAGDVVLLVAELVSNALLHGGGPVELVLDATADRLRIEVSDRTSTLPTPHRPHHPALPGGHGLYIVERAADRWGAQPQPTGKTIWAEVEAKRLRTGS
ncbi:ATP-binding protein [Kitasatospora sp. NPDC006697]|uniref:ATP-binding protein n=1 Tax=Kitasatospora sp. NPDC006697 TaxID=3364020 RepID=UPI003692073B